MPAYQTQAVVLKSRDFGESDKLVSFFTSDFGKIRGIAKSAKKSKKRFGAALEPGTCGRLDFFAKPHLTLKRINGMEIKTPLPGLWASLANLMAASYLVSLVDEFTPDEHKSPEVFALLTYFLELVNRRGAEDGLLRIFEIRLLRACGLQPNLEYCTVCGAPWDGRCAMGFAAAVGGVVCSQCRTRFPESRMLDPGTCRFLLSSLKLELENIARLHFTDQADRQSRTALQDFIRYHLGREVRAFSVLNQLAG